jgi:hypothetical protein
MAAKPGTLYENLTQVIFQSLVDQNEVRNIEVKHDVKLQGKSNVFHQIDVYWKFEVGGVEHETIVQAKDWKTPVNKGELLKFNTVLTDLPGQPRGVFVSRTGYQKGAVDFAFAYGILIYELREAEAPPGFGMYPGDWANFRIIRLPLRAIITMTVETVAAEDNFYGLGYGVNIFTPTYSKPEFNVSASWLQAEYPATDTSQIKALDFSPGPLHATHLYDAEGVVTGNLAALFQKLAKEAHQTGLLKMRVKQIFEAPTFILSGSSSTPRIKIDAVSVDVEIQCRHEVVRMRMDQFPQWVLRQINSRSV